MRFLPELCHFPRPLYTPAMQTNSNPQYLKPFSNSHLFPLSLELLIRLLVGGEVLMYSGKSLLAINFLLRNDHVFIKPRLLKT